MTDYEVVIGLEVHAQLLTKTKLFCGCSTNFGQPPNTNICPVCLGLPGSLPVINGEAVELAVKTALALGCTIHESSIFARKNYFYPDLPKGYQISQFEEPFSTHGHLDIEVDGKAKRVGITRAHLEEDAGKNLHGVGGDSVVDLNRAGTPLVEIVGEPDLRSSAEAAAYLRALRDLLVFSGVNDGNLEEGSFRCDANVSIRPRGTEKFGTRCELKNINSFRYVQRAIDHGGRDLRIFVIGGRVLGAIERHAPEGEWRTNVAIGGAAVAVDVSPEIERVAIAAAGAIPSAGQGLHGAGGDVVHAAHAVDLAVLGRVLRIGLGPAGVVVHQGTCLGGVDLQALLHGLFLVVVALDQRFASHVVLAFNFGRIELDVVGTAGGRV